MRKTYSLFFLLALVFSGSAKAQSLPESSREPSPTPDLLTLEQALELGLNQNRNLRAQYTQVEMAEARQGQARAAAFPKITGTAIFSPIFGVSGNAISSQDDANRWGVWLQSTLQILQPIYTWGKIEGYKTASREGTAVANAQYRKDKNQAAYEIKEAYFGAVLAEQLFNFLAQGKSDLQKVIEKAEKDQAKAQPQIARRDYFRLKIFTAEADYRYAEAEKMRTLARQALSLRIGKDPQFETLPAETTITAIEGTLPQDSNLVTLLNAYRPEFEQLNHGIAAKKALLQVESSNKYPTFFLGGQLSLAYSNVRDKQGSAFAYDPYNRSTGGVGIGFQWNFDFFTTAANEQLLRVEIAELEFKQAYAVHGLALEARKAKGELAEALTRWKSSHEAYSIGQRWLNSEALTYDANPGNSANLKNLIDAYLARAKTAKDLWEGSFKVNMAWAELSRVIGVEVTPGLPNSQYAKIR